MTVETSALTATRQTLHGVAEQIMAAHTRRMTGSIRLAVRDGALSTVDLPGPISRIELRDAALVRFPGGHGVPVVGPLGEVASHLGVEFGMPDPPYPPASGCGPEHEAVLDLKATALIEYAWRAGDHALRALADQTPVVWPEHLDIGITVGDVNYGVSPGDGYLEQPYAYVGPHVPRSGPFWNAPFGAVRTVAALTSSGDAVAATLAFFIEGRDLAATASLRSPSTP